MKETLGEEKFQELRRGWDVPIPEGESLKNVYERVVPYYTEHILPVLESGRNVLVVAHGNSLRSLVKYLERVPDDRVAELELGTGEAHVYSIDPDGSMHGKEVRAVNAKKV